MAKALFPKLRRAASLLRVSSPNSFLVRYSLYLSVSHPGQFSRNFFIFLFLVFLLVCFFFFQTPLNPLMVVGKLTWVMDKSLPPLPLTTRYGFQYSALGFEVSRFPANFLSPFQVDFGSPRINF
jgi:hypothetical protein